MKEIICKCPLCNEQLTCETEWFGYAITCPLCGREFILSCDMAVNQVEPPVVTPAVNQVATPVVTPVVTPAVNQVVTPVVTPPPPTFKPMVTPVAPPPPPTFKPMVTPVAPPPPPTLKPMVTPVAPPPPKLKPVLNAPPKLKPVLNAPPKLKPALNAPPKLKPVLTPAEKSKPENVNEPEKSENKPAEVPPVKEENAPEIEIKLRKNSPVEAENISNTPVPAKKDEVRPQEDDLFIQLRPPVGAQTQIQNVSAPRMAVPPQTAEPTKNVDDAETEETPELAEPTKNVDAAETEETPELAEPTKNVDDAETEETPELAEPTKNVNAAETEKTPELAKPPKLILRKKSGSPSAPSPFAPVNRENGDKDVPPEDKYEKEEEKKDKPKTTPNISAFISIITALVSIVCTIFSYIAKTPFFMVIATITALLTLIPICISAADKSRYDRFKMNTANKTILLTTLFISLGNGIFSATAGGGWDYTYHWFVVSPMEREIKAEGVPYIDIFGNHHNVTPEKVELKSLGNGKYIGKTTFTLEGVTYTRTLAAFDADVIDGNMKYTLFWMISTNFNGDVEEFKHSVTNDLKRANIFYQARETSPKYKMKLEEINIRESDLKEENCEIDVLFKIIGPDGRSKMEKATLRMNGIQATEQLMATHGDLDKKAVMDFREPGISWEFESGSRIKYPSPGKQ